MKYFAFENFSLRILSVVVAVIGWFYVNIIVNPIEERQFDVELSLTDKRNDCLYKNAQPKVSIFIRGGRRDIIENYYPIKAKLLASANVSKASADTNNKIPVSIALPRGLELVKTEPREIEVSPVLIEESSVNINVIISGDVKPGYYVKSYEVNPKTVKIRGPKKNIGGIKQLGTQISVAGLDSNLTLRQPIHLVEVTPNENADITIFPKEVDISVVIQPMPSKQVNIVAQVTGKVAPGYKIATIECEPKNILIKGLSEKIGKINEIMSEPIDVSNITSGLVQNVNLTMPPNAEYAIDNKPVSITVTLQPIYKTQKFNDVKINVPIMPPGYEISLENEKIDIAVNAPLNKLYELSSSSISLDAKNTAEKFSTGSVWLELSLRGLTSQVEIKPAQIKANIRQKQ